jgi:RHH-type transcriptional regulator, rel operon repressor / antitoxin RelB
MNNDTPISVRLSKKTNSILDTLAEELHITKTQLIREAIMERVEDYLDIKTIEQAVKNNSKTYTMEEMKARYGLDS